MNSFISWIGGKKLLRKEIIANFPKDNIERYIEVFGGAGWVLFGKEKHATLEVFNDANSELINLYRCVKYHCNELQHELDWLLNSREVFYNVKKQLENPDYLTDIQRAARYFYLIKISFGSDKKTFGTNIKNLNSSIEYLEAIKERLKNVVIENKDFENLIKVYDRKNALFYLDPPYYGTEKYYNIEFTQKDHERLAETLKNIKGRFVLSYNKCDFIKNLYECFQIIEVSRHNNLTARIKSENYEEYIIKNYS